MKQVAQRLRDGRIEVLDVPLPELRPEGILVDVRASLVSAGTERKKVETGRRTLVGKARARPDQVRRVVDMARRDGVSKTVRAVRFRLDQPAPLGYAAAGVVVAAGSRVRDLAPGDRVACAGADHAVHAEIDYVPANLAVPIPDGVDFGHAAFTTLGAIALHGVRQADVRLGERVAVIGLGLVGQLAGQIVRASGCRVVGIDLSEDLVDRALSLGAADTAYVRERLDGELPADASDCDAVLITAATTSSDPVRLAPALSRDRGRVVVVGDIGMEIPRDAYYEKELDVRTSRSYGPGRYDAEYEERGLDYPIGYVRWTERRNMRAFLELVASGKVEVERLVAERVRVDDAPSAYERLVSAPSSPLGIVIEYEPGPEPTPERPAPAAPVEPAGAVDHVGLVGAGGFAGSVLIPALRDAGFVLEAAASASGLSARGVADMFGFRRCGTPEEVIADPSVGLVAVATRHDSHASLAVRALRAGKAVFVEKPPALTERELDDVRLARDESRRPLAVGFNRRHAPLAQALRRFVTETRRPVELLYRVNAGPLEPDHWLNDLDEGGGRLLGEGCHFVDFACWVVGSLPEHVSCAIRPEPGVPLASAQSFTLTLDFADGSLASVVYAASGSTALGKEYVEAHSGGRSAVLDDFRSLELLAGRRRRRFGRRSQDKGHARQMAELRRILAGDAVPSAPDPLDTMGVTLAALRSGEERRPLSAR